MKLLLSLFLILLAIVAQSQTIAPMNDSVRQRLQTFEKLPAQHQIRLANEDEAGTPMLLMVEVYARDCDCPLPLAEVFMTQTSDAGVYDLERQNDWTSARLRGTIRTDEKGRFLLRSIVPGRYPTSKTANPHIHTMIEVADPIYYDIMFAPYLNVFGKRSIAQKPDQNFVARMWREDQNGLVGYVRIYVKQ